MFGLICGKASPIHAAGGSAVHLPTSFSLWWSGPKMLHQFSHGTLSSLRNLFVYYPSPGDVEAFAAFGLTPASGDSQCCCLNMTTSCREGSTYISCQLEVAAQHHVASYTYISRVSLQILTYRPCRPRLSWSPAPTPALGLRLSRPFVASEQTYTILMGSQSLD